MTDQAAGGVQDFHALRRRVAQAHAFCLRIGLKSSSYVVSLHRFRTLGVALGCAGGERVMGWIVAVDRVTHSLLWGYRIAQPGSQPRGNNTAEQHEAMAMVQKFGMNKSSMDGKILKSLQPVANTIMDEIRKSVAFYTNENPDAKFEKLVFTGGAAGMPELPLYVANSVKLPVELGNAWLNVSYPADMQSDLAAVNREYAVAVGCAARMVM